MGLRDFLSPKKVTIIKETVTENKPVRTKDGIINIPPGRVSEPTLKTETRDLVNSTRYLKTSFVREQIPTIRALYKCNEDLGLVLFDLVQLTNTGHKVHFDKSVSPKCTDEMRRHLKKVSKNWGVGTAGIDGLINKMIAQVYVGGALSNEWAPNRNLRGIDFVALVNPEEIYFSKTTKKGRYKPWQDTSKKNNRFFTNIEKTFKKLNENTYKYFGLLNDTDEPYGIPPFLTALNAIATQDEMKKNINFIMKQMGLMGFLEVLIEKPDQNADESVDAYRARLTKLLGDTKKNTSEGMSDGVMAGYSEDHEFKFHATTQNLTNVGDVFNQNETQIANGLKTPPSFMGINKSSGTETAISIIFTKMLAQLKNVQDLVKANLEFGYKLELLLAGFDYGENLTVEFNPSTITDDLKMQQAGEIKRRNLKSDYDQGLISQDTFADQLGYEEPDQKEPRISQSQPIEDEKDRKKREKDKDDSDRRSRDKKKDNPKRRDRDTRKP